MVDRFLSRPSCSAQAYLNDRKKFQLLVITALYTVIKFTEPDAFGSVDFAEMTRMYSAQDIEDMELTLLCGLEWHITAPTSLQVAYHILSLILPCVELEESTWGFILDEVKYHTEFAVRDYYFSTKRTSTAALAAIFAALDQVDDLQECQDTWTGLLLVAGKYFATPQELIAAKNRLASLVERDGPREEATVVSDTSWNLDASSPPPSFSSSSLFDLSCSSFEAESSIVSASSSEDDTSVDVDDTSWSLEASSSFNVSCPSIHASVMSASSEEDISDVASWNLEDRSSFNASCPSIQASAVSGFHRSKHLHCRCRSSTCS